MMKGDVECGVESGDDEVVFGGCIYGEFLGS